jgi:hypothetical protein
VCVCVCVSWVVCINEIENWKCAALCVTGTSSESHTQRAEKNVFNISICQRNMPQPRYQFVSRRSLSLLLFDLKNSPFAFCTIKSINKLLSCAHRMNVPLPSHSISLAFLFYFPRNIWQFHVARWRTDCCCLFPLTGESCRNVQLAAVAIVTA